MAEGDREVTREEVVELADAVAASGGIASGIGTSRLRRAAGRRGRGPGGRGRAGHGRVRPGRGRGPACRRGRSPRAAAISEDEDDGRARMIRLGSLAGYPFEGPRVLGGWTAAGQARGVRDHVQAGAGGQARDVRGDLRRPRRATCRPSSSRSTTRGRSAGSSGPAAGGRSTSARTRCPAGCRRTGSRSPTSSARSTSPSCNDAAVRPSWKDEWIGGTTSSSPGLAKDPARPESAPG